VDVDSIEDEEEFCRLAMEADWVARMIYGDGSDPKAANDKPNKGNKGKQITKRTM
jgi:hypothetical protein